jgi:hypothetical protein
LAVTNDEFALSPADGEHGINSDNTCLHRCIYTFSFNHAGGGTLNGTNFRGIDWTFPIHRVTQRINYSTNERITDGNRGNTTRGTDFVTYLNVGIVAHNDHTYTLGLQVQRQTSSTVAKLYQLAGSYICETIYLSYTVVNGRYRSNTTRLNLMIEILNLP